MDDRTEKPIIFAIMTLFLTFVVVYMVFFRNQWDDVSLSLSSLADTWTNLAANTWTNKEISDSMSSWLTTNIVSSWLLDWSWSFLSWNINADEEGRVSLWSSSPAITGSASNDQSWELKKRLSTVSGVSLWYNSIKMAETLALDVKFAFTDTGNIVYAYLGTGSRETSNEIIKRLWWNSVEIETENDIIKNLLRWDRVTFINIPSVTFVRKWTTEQKLLVTMVIEIGEDKRLIQSPFDRYHSGKKRMKTIFEILYGKIL